MNDIVVFDRQADSFNELAVRGVINEAFEWIKGAMLMDVPLLITVSNGRMVITRIAESNDDG